jgi:uroporphyrinogen decarboxylase
MATPEPDYTRLLLTLRGGQADRVPLAELIVDPELKEAYLGRPIQTVADDIEFWWSAGYDCATVYPNSPTIWFYEESRSDTVLADEHTATGTRRWASETEGLIKDWDDLEAHPLPTLNEIDFSYFECAPLYLPSGMGLIGAWGDIFTYAWEAMGFETFAFALYDQPEFVAHLFKQLGGLALQICEALLSFDVVKALWFSDDLAYSSGFLVSPDIYRQHLFPWLKKIGELCQKAERPFIFHSDGVLWGVMKDLADCGFCALQPIEPAAMDIREVKRRYGDVFCLIGNVDVDLLARARPDEVRDVVRTLLREVAPGGGYCLGSGNTVPNYARVDNYRAMIEEGLRHGGYPITL